MRIPPGRPVFEPCEPVFLSLIHIFFQHHNPLLWYLFAPFVGLHAYGLDDNVITSSVVTAAILASFLTYYYLYLIASRFLTGKRGGVIAAAIAFTPYVLVSVVNFRPDKDVYKRQRVRLLTGI